MERDVIERLALDSAGGELNEDVEALFEAYLREHPEARRWAEDSAAIYGKTQAAIQAKTAEAGASTMPLRIGPLSRVSWRPVARWAAVIALAVLGGAALERWSQTGVVGPEGERVVYTERAAVVGPHAAGSFWRAKVMGLLESQADAQGEAYSEDVSLWGMYAGYMKGTYDE